MAYLKTFHLLADYTIPFVPIIRNFERFSNAAYYDPADKHNVTIGDGINIDYTNIVQLKLVLNGMGLIAAADAKEAQRRLDAGLAPETAAERTARIDSMVAEFQSTFELHRPPVGATQDEVNKATSDLDIDLDALASKFGSVPAFTINQDQSATVVRLLLKGGSIPGVLDSFTEPKGSDSIEILTRCTIA